MRTFLENVAGHSNGLLRGSFIQHIFTLRSFPSHQALDKMWRADSQLIDRLLGGNSGDKGGWRT